MGIIWIHLIVLFVTTMIGIKVGDLVTRRTKGMARLPRVAAIGGALLATVAAVIGLLDTGGYFDYVREARAT